MEQNYSAIYNLNALLNDVFRGIPMTTRTHRRKHPYKWEISISAKGEKVVYTVNLERSNITDRQLGRITARYRCLAVRAENDNLYLSLTFY